MQGSLSQAGVGRDGGVARFRLGFQIGSQVPVFSAGLVRSRGSLQLAMAGPTSLIGLLALQ